MQHALYTDKALFRIEESPLMRRLMVIAAVLSSLCVLSIPAAAKEPDDHFAVNPAGLALSAVRDGTRLLALTVVPIGQFPSFDRVVMCESGWNLFAVNPVSGAYGLGQALPPEKMETHGSDWRYNPLTQIRWTYDYMNQRYGSPDGAWAFWQKHHWY